MKILFLNTWAAEMKDDLKEYIQKHADSTDIFCLQETHAVTMPLYRELLAATHDEFFIHKPIANQPGFSLAIFVRKNITLLSHQSIMQSEMDCGLALYVHLRVHDTDIHLCNVHGTPLPGDKLDTNQRILLSQTIINHMQNKQGLKIIGGDFNLLPNTQSVRIFEMNNYRNLIEEYSIDTTRNELSWKNYSTRQYYADYIFISQETPVVSFFVPKNEVSDHLPLILTL